MFFNPYYNKTFFEVILLFFYRLAALLTGHLSFSELATDDIQILVLTGVAASSALLGVFLVLRRMTMLANSLSHTILIGIVLAFVLTNNYGSSEESSHTLPMQAMLFASLLMAFITAFLTEFLTKVMRLQEDASTGIVFTSLFALGIVLLTILTKDAHIGTEAVMGNADALHVQDVKWILSIFVVNACIVWLFFKEYKITTFDPALATALGFSNVFFNYLLMAQVAATSIGSFRAVGVLLVLAFMTGPPLTALLLFNDLKKVIYCAIGIGCLSALLGVAFARHLLTVYGMALSTSGIVVCFVVFFYLCAIFFAPKKGIIAAGLHRKKLIKKHNL